MAGESWVGEGRAGLKGIPLTWLPVSLQAQPTQSFRLCHGLTSAKHLPLVATTPTPAGSQTVGTPAREEGMGNGHTALLVQLSKRTQSHGKDVLYNIDAVCMMIVAKT